MAAPLDEPEDCAFPIQERTIDPEVQALREVHDALVVLEGQGDGEAIKRVLTWAQARFLGDTKPSWTPQVPAESRRHPTDDLPGPRR